MRAGVTLLELLVAVAITVIVGASIIGALYSGRSAWEAGQNIIDRHQNARAAIDFISRDLQQAVVFSDGAVYRADFLSGSRSGFRGGDSVLLLFTALSGNAQEGFELVWIEYRIQGEIIWRRKWLYGEALPETPPAWGEGHQVAWDIESLSFSFDYFDGSGWEYEEPDWDYEDTPPKGGRLPDRVNITIKPVDSDNNIVSSVRMPLSRLTPYVGH